MAFDWAKYLILAEELAMRMSDEASLRSAVSRAYYAAFCTARNRLLQEGEDIPETGDAHRIIWTKLRESIQKDRKEIGINGSRLRESRRRADYENEYPNLGAAVEDAVAKARYVLSLIQDLK
jgi:uncharacterized protein (UPF0332 family)